MKLKLLLLYFFSQFAVAQQRTCGMETQMQRIMDDSIAKQIYLDFQSKFNIELSKLENSSKKVASPQATIRIPVAVHYPATLESASASLKTCLINLAQNQINILNADYNRTNADYATWTNSASTHFPGVVGGIMDVQFVLATQNHPAGTGLVNGDVAVTFGTDFLGSDENDMTWQGYMNIVVKYANGYLGYSPLGGSPSSAATVVIDTAAFGSGSGCFGYVPGSPYNLGRTVTHELGHFFNLDHTFAGCDSGSCATSGDFVCDTPPQDDNAGGCPVVGSVLNCGVKSLTMNYMDYTDDACMYMFTAGQAARMQAWYNTVASTVKTNVLANNEFLVNNFSITPNPNNGNFTINLNEVLNNYTLQVFDATGRLMFRKEFNQTQNVQQNVSLNNPQSGLYFVTITSDNVILTRKIIVQ